MADLAVWPTDGAGPGGDGSVSSEARWRKMGRTWVPSGVDTSLLGVGGGVGALAPTLVAGPAIQVAAGSCWLDGHYAELTAQATIPASASGLLVVRFTPADNHAELVYRDAATVLTQTLATWELPIAQMLAGAMRDIRWRLGGDGGVELGYANNPAVVSITSAHTQASPVDVVNVGWCYCDGGPVILEFASMIFGNVAPTSGYLYCRPWLDGAELATERPLAVAYGATFGNVFQRARPNAPIPAGVHQIRGRAYGTAGVTAATAYGPNTLRVLRG